jgi:tetratricopeptide (TPR) repeat protein
MLHRESTKLVERSMTVFQTRTRPRASSATGLHFLLLLAAAMAFQPALSAQQQSMARKPLPKPAQTKSDPRFHGAEALLEQGRLDEAKQEVQAVLAQEANSVEGYNLLGIVCISQKDYACAEEALRRALKISPASPRTRNNLGNLYVAEQRLDLAEKEFREALRVAPSNADAHYNLGLVLLAANKAADAAVHFLRVTPPTQTSQLGLLRAEVRSGRVAEGLQVASDLAANSPQDVQLHYTLGVVLASEKQYHAAQRELEKANSLQPEAFDILFNLGQAYLRGGDYRQAELILKRAQGLKPDSPEALYMLAQVYNDQSRPVDALELLVRAHKLAPEDPDIIFLLARVSMTQNYFEDAIPLLESGIRLAPKRADLRAALGESYFMSGRTDKAVEVFNELVEVDPRPPSYAFLGLSYRHLGRFDEARKYFSEGLRLDPRNASCLFNMGYIESRQGNPAKAEEYFQETLKAEPDYAEALLELANLRISAKRNAEAADLLRRYVKVARDPSSGYYKLAMVERSLKQNDAAQRDLNVFQTLSKNTSPGPYPYQHLFDYLDNRATLTARERTQLDLTELENQIKMHPGRPQDLYLLAEAYLKLGKIDEARQTVAQLDQIGSEDFRMQTGVGVLLASHHLYDDAIRHFQAAAKANPQSDDVKFDLADAYFRKGLHSLALETAESVSAEGQKDDSYLALLGDIESHLGDSAKAARIFQDAIQRNPDNDQYYLSLSLAQLRSGDLNGADATLKQGRKRVPGSGKILWGLGVVSALHGESAQAVEQLARAVDLLPEWAGSYSTLGVLYYQTGQYDKAREVLSRFKGSHSGGLDVHRIEQALANAPQTSAATAQPLPPAARQQFLQIALSLADRTL